MLARRYPMKSGSKDSRSGKLCIVAHCLINQNSRVYGGAKSPGMIKPILRALETRDFGIVQLPCPETVHVGLKRWWQTREQYNIPRFKRSCQEMLQPTYDLIEASYRENYEMALLGVQRSPSCGLFITASDTSWYGKPTAIDKTPTIEGRGVFMEVFLDGLKSRDIPIPELFEVNTELPEDVTQRELEKFLDNATQGSFRE
jgi:predicted secreted protein